MGNGSTRCGAGTVSPVAAQNKDQAYAKVLPASIARILLRSGDVESFIRGVYDESESRKISEVLAACRCIYIQSGGYRQVAEEIGHAEFGNTFSDSESLVNYLRNECPVLFSNDRGLEHQASLINNGVHESKSDNISLIHSRVLNDTEFFAISLVTPVISQAFCDSEPQCLFSLAEKGESWIRFVKCLDQYPGPALFVLSTKNGERVGAFVNGGLKESSTKYFGDESTFLFGMNKEFRVIRPSGTQSNFVLLNATSTFIPQGLGFGGNEGEFRLHICSDLKKMSCTLACSTFKYGGLVDMKEDGVDRYNQECELKDFEVWGLGTKDDYENQRAAASRDEKIRLERRQVDKALLARDADVFKPKVQGGERQGEVDVIVEERRRQRENNVQ